MELAGLSELLITISDDGRVEASLSDQRRAQNSRHHMTHAIGAPSKSRVSPAICRNTAER
jgi:hypothetical protein